MSSHARSSYLVRDGEDWLLYERGKDVSRLSEPSNFRFLQFLNSPAYTHLFGRQDQSGLPSVLALEDLGLAIASGPYDPLSDSDIPSGYTYLGQFIFHDISFMGRERDPSNERTAALDLDSVLPLSGLATPQTGCLGTGPLAVGCTSGYVMAEDLPRRDDGTADAAYPLIRDRRNDDFLPLAQCHLALLKFFNAIAAREQYLSGNRAAPPDKAWWLRVRKIWLQHFQSVVLHDYLPRVVDRKTYASVMRDGRAVVRVDASADEQDWLPIEFAAAVGRFGHSMIRDRYSPWNAIESSAIFRDFIQSSYANSGDRLASTDHRLLRNWVTNWYLLLDFSGIAGAASGRPIYAGLIDTFLAPALAELPACLPDDVCINPVPGNFFPLATQTLKRGRMLGIASAQQAIAFVNNALEAVQQPPIPSVPAEQIPGPRPGLAAVFGAGAHPELMTATPLWYYVLREAEYFSGGYHLGPLASRLVMETLHAAIGASADSILRESNWLPTLPSAHPCRFSMADLIEFSGDLNPLD